MPHGRGAFDQEEPPTRDLCSSLEGWKSWTDKGDGRVYVEQSPPDLPDVISRVLWEPNLGPSAHGGIGYRSAPFALPVAPAGVPACDPGGPGRAPGLCILHFVPALPSTEVGQPKPAAPVAALTDLGEQGHRFGGIFLEAPPGIALRFRVFAGERVSGTLEGRWTGRRRRIGAGLFFDREEMMENLVAVFPVNEHQRRRGRAAAKVLPLLVGVEVLDELGVLEQQEGGAEEKDQPSTISKLADVDEKDDEALAQQEDAAAEKRLPPARARAVWKVPRVGWKCRRYAKGEGVASPTFHLAGLGPFQFRLLPNGDRKASGGGWAVVHLEAPLRTFLQASLEVGPLATSPNSSSGVPGGMMSPTTTQSTQGSHGVRSSVLIMKNPQGVASTRCVTGSLTSASSGVSLGPSVTGSLGKQHMQQHHPARGCGSLAAPLEHGFEKSRRVGAPVPDLLSRAYPHDAVEISLEIAPGERFRVVGVVRAQPCPRPQHAIDGTETTDFTRLGVRRVSWQIEEAAALVQNARPGESVHSPEFEVDGPNYGPPQKFRLQFFPNSTLGGQRLGGLGPEEAPMWGTRVSRGSSSKQGSLYLQAVDTRASVPSGVHCRWFVGKAARERLIQHGSDDALSTVMRREASNAYGVHEVFDSAEELERDGSLTLGLYMHYTCTLARRQRSS